MTARKRIIHCEGANDRPLCGGPKRSRTTSIHLYKLSGNDKWDTCPDCDALAGVVDLSMTPAVSKAIAQILALRDAFDALSRADAHRLMRSLEEIHVAAVIRGDADRVRHVEELHHIADAASLMLLDLTDGVREYLHESHGLDCISDFDHLTGDGPAEMGAAAQ